MENTDSRKEANMKNQTHLGIIILFGLLLSPFTWAQSSAKEGLQQLKSNLQNSKANLEDYKKNLKISEDNIAEVQKAKAQVQTQQQQSSVAFKENQEKIEVLGKNELELNQLIALEEKEIALEEQKLVELNKLVQQLKENQAKRQQNISAYKDQLKQVDKEKSDWKNRGEQIAKTQQNIDLRLKALSDQEAEWVLKRRGYQGEAQRWTKEVERQQKLNDNYSSLAEVKE